MYKPGASFYDPDTDKTLVCCSGTIYASLGIQNRNKNYYVPGVPKKMFISEPCTLLTNEHFFWDTLQVCINRIVQVLQKVVADPSIQGKDS